ncbi:GNAT family N-acetyltransferase [Saccharibacillus sp. O23]|uniref:GNAT family N-acetyltransferase n=1 Tax=Saccharibacillus sp. O23 TaxID=2009338 RepID=UPI000B4E172E|nr:GNAT family N-acetyltransferase [Saccharibacillus sp. O23]OWR30835.1 GNAT family N-acetyltransferase [Saccharibacillus sp. O23]
MEHVKLVPMSEEEFRIFRARAVIEYAEDKVKAGVWAEEEARELSEDTYSRYLPDGTATREHYLYTIYWGKKQQNVGCIWLHVPDAPAGKRAFLYEIRIEDDVQGLGLGQAAMHALDETARSLGASSIGLHVFGHNPAALHVYEKAGYVVTDYKMAKTL